MNQQPPLSTDIQIAICGSAGDGTIATGDILKRAMARAGYNVIAFDLYPPEIRGFGKCIARTRITSEQVFSLKLRSDVLISLNDAYAIHHVHEVDDFGAVIYDNTPITMIQEGEHISGHLAPAHLPYAIPFREISERMTSSAKSRNMVAVGYLAGLYDIPREVFHDTIKSKFKTKPSALTESILTAFNAGFDEGVATFHLGFNVLSTAPQSAVKDEVIMMNGNDAVVRGCLDAGIKTFFGYPITPATSIMEKLAVEMPKHGNAMVQTEDEISAIAAAIGAGFTGVRSATATSGPGLALMTEMMGLATVAEVPVVIFVSQRGGPSTGMPTKTEQSDLNLAVYGATGDGQRIVLAPTNVEGCYWCAGKAFEMAERYQTPVIVLLDLYLSNRYEAVSLSRSKTFDQDSNKWVHKHQNDMRYRRFEITDDWVSPRAIPGEKDLQHVVTGLEHNELGRPNDQSNIHTQMSHKRHQKLQPALIHPDITIFKRFGDQGRVQIGLLGWGSSFGEILEALFKAQGEDISCAAMKVVMLSPFPTSEVSAFMDDCDAVLVPELNYQGQFANLVGAMVGRSVHRLTRVNGMPMHVEEIMLEIRRLRDPGAPPPPASNTLTNQEKLT
ncbi:MAG: 2-oxoacid:acceptor oxidoreductase subunit alpha [Candidatus Thiodiazotropha sp. (ex Lucinoma aequizonata)]|nr:2-oxoacid:acceptor oxidoreductase subunit alpha [Candidatus Thiodiazotropha sp. (ex Lucinoma aequizonata)]MCU7887744.1 2-oxoacid:acceptor oxidoreductase subunit alpha [Candidatus Thiodiazotropha sp. (ex Lucinoma aequizonata)]MCU7897021.1 2-oxoacid:acceptor oxidoreductase subunit alpha [Candidatus Thiodiazotropha sp. (ex Lucinoma aequizonata)]MCU7898214.1 2-oxoacid:acceptor oxidoreductase subunit alpha [Candidatus Thiodiazotropha sp. (ex Lucinoma aequizonata)]MCU7903061.1 2-oxoacid:acceptor o